MARISTDKVRAALHFVSAIIVLCFVFLSSCKDHSTGPTKNIDSTTVSPGYGKDTTVFAPATMRVGTKDSIIISNWRGDAGFLDFTDMYNNVREGRASVYYGTRRIPILSLAYDSLKKHTVVCFIAQPSTEHIQQPDTYVKQFLALGVYIGNEKIFYTSKTATTLVYPQGQARSVTFSLSGLSIVSNMTRQKSSTPATNFFDTVNVSAMMKADLKRWNIIEYTDSSTTLFYPTVKTTIADQYTSRSEFIVFKVENKPSTVSISVQYEYYYRQTRDYYYGNPWGSSNTRTEGVKTELLIKEYPKSALWPRQTIVLRASDFATQLAVAHQQGYSYIESWRDRYGSGSASTSETLNSFELLVDPTAELTIEFK